jgi:hypothetical protein
VGAIIFHPGIGKTATSAIQNLGVKLPTDDPNSVCFSPYGLLGNVHNALANNHPQFDYAVYEEEIAHLINFAKSRKADTVVSSEFLIRCSAEHIKNMLNLIKKSGIEVRVLFVIRNYSDYIISSYLQAVKVRWGMRPNENLVDYAKREILNVRLLMLIDQWARVVGDEQIFILDYDKSRNTLVKEFFNFIGFYDLGGLEVDKVVNPSIPLSAANILLEFDKVSDDAEKRLNIINLLSRTAYKSSYDDYLRKGVREVVKESYQHDYSRLSDRYQILNKKEEQ